MTLFCCRQDEFNDDDEPPQLASVQNEVMSGNGDGFIICDVIVVVVGRSSIPFHLVSPHLFPFPPPPPADQGDRQLDVISRQISATCNSITIK